MATLNVGPLNVGPLNLGQLGGFLREQRRTAQLSLRSLTDQAGAPGAYLGQLERGLRKPSAEVLQQVARGLRVSANQLYAQAGAIDNRPADELAVESALLADASITERQKRVLLELYHSFRTETGAGRVQPAVEPAVEPAGEATVEAFEDDEAGDTGAVTPPA